MKPCTIVVTNKGRRLIQPSVVGIRRVTELETRITDDASGRELNREVTHSAEKDTLTFKVFYKEQK